MRGGHKRRTIVPELKTILELIRDYDAVLGTAHISPEESFAVVEAARNLGVKKIVVTHPEWWVVGMTMEDQIRMVKDYECDPGALLCPEHGRRNI